MMANFYKKTSIASIATLLVAVQASASTEEISAQDSPYVGGLFVRLASLVDSTALAFLDGVVVTAILLFIGGVIMWLKAPKSNLPRQMAVVLIAVSMMLGSLKGCASMNSQTYLGTSEVEAYRNIEEQQRNGYFESNTD